MTDHEKQLQLMEKVGDHMEDMEDFVNESIHRFQEYLSQKPKEEPKSWDRLNQFFIEETRAHL